MFTDIYILGIGSLCTPISKRCSHDNLPDNLHLVHLQCCKLVILSVLVYITGHSFVYSHTQPYRALINLNARPKSVDAPLTLIFMIGHRAYCFLFVWEWRPILSVCIKTAKSLINYLAYKRNYCWSSVDTHFQNRAGSVTIFLLPIKAACTSFMNVCNRSPCRVTMMQSQILSMHRWLSFSNWGR
jgi:hypothetical protein